MWSAQRVSVLLVSMTTRNSLLPHDAGTMPKLFELLRRTNPESLAHKVRVLYNRSISSDHLFLNKFFISVLKYYFLSHAVQN